MVVIGFYLPLNYPVKRAKGALSFIADCITQAKRKFNDPIVVVAGDFNQWKAESAVKDFIDLKEAKVGKTRGDHSIDRLFCNYDVTCLLYTSPSPRDKRQSRMPSSA